MLPTLPPSSNPKLAPDSPALLAHYLPILQLGTYYPAPLPSTSAWLVTPLTLMA